MTSRTNNDLEHVFGQWLHHQRRCTRRKIAPATAVPFLSGG
ncbi:MAG TPA: hypothetical protein V6D16_12810 [Candidatus Obscuribacterales bacterium]